MKQISGKKGKRLTVTALLLMAVFTVAFAQEPFHIIEGSTHSFSVKPGNPNSTLVWGMYVNPYDNVQFDALAYSIDDPISDSVTVVFSDTGKDAAEIIYLVVKETAPNGCSTKRALQILLEPNNMYFDFADNSETSDCYNLGIEYNAQVAIGMDFNSRSGEDYQPIPEDRFPLKIKYTVEDVTNNQTLRNETADYVEIAYNPENDYALVVSEAKGEVATTTEYVLQITEVVDQYNTQITHDKDRRLQIRIINHLPQSGDMDMAMAYVVSPISYNGKL